MPTMSQRPLPFAKISALDNGNLVQLNRQIGIETSDLSGRLLALSRKVISESVRSAVASWFQTGTAASMLVSNARDIPVIETSARKLIEVGEDRIVHVDQVDTADGSGVIVRLNDTKQGNSVQLYFRRRGALLELMSNNSVVAEIPSDGLPIAALLLVSAYISANISITKRKQTSSRSKSGEETQEDNNCPRDPNGGSFSFGHDLVCTFPVEGIVTADGRIYMYVFCLFSVERIEINALDCCKKHDIGLWCSESNLQAAGADELVLACFTGAIIQQTLSKLSPACGFFIGGYVQVLALAVGLYVVLAVLVAWWVNLLHGETLIGYGGRNRDSCLCGGKVPTHFCNNRCRDACAVAGKESECGNCSWACDYDIETGKARGYKLLPPKNGKPCCPGTEAWCLPKPKLPLNYVCPDRAKGCYDCKIRV